MFVLVFYINLLCTFKWLKFIFSCKIRVDSILVFDISVLNFIFLGKFDNKTQNFSEKYSCGIHFN